MHGNVIRYGDIGSPQAFELIRGPSKTGEGGMCCCSQKQSQLTRGTKCTRPNSLCRKCSFKKSVIKKNPEKDTFCLAYDGVKSKLNNFNKDTKLYRRRGQRHPTPDSWALLKKKKKSKMAEENNAKPLLTHCFNHVITPEEVDLSPLPVT